MIVILCSACSASQQRVSVAFERSDCDIARISDLLYVMPDWSSFAMNDKEPEWRFSIERAFECIARNRIEDIEAVVVAHANDYSGGLYERGARHTKLFLLNKYLFNLPDSIRRDNPHYIAFVAGGYVQSLSGQPGNPQPSDELNGRWPWSADETGVWRLTGTFRGAAGPPYDSVAAFQYFREHYGVRRLKD